MTALRAEATTAAGRTELITALHDDLGTYLASHTPSRSARTSCDRA
ncbi:hypothetical protein [Streptomyces sp. NPDC049915]